MKSFNDYTVNSEIYSIVKLSGQNCNQNHKSDD